VVRVVGQEPLEDSVAEGVAELAGADALPEPLGCEPSPLEGAGVEPVGCGLLLALPEPPPLPGAVAEQLQSVTVIVFTTVIGEPGRGDSDGAEEVGTELEGAGAEEPVPYPGVDSDTEAELAGVDWVEGLD
jgi:hypothetical protein